MQTQFIYLHGFASGPNSNKAKAFKKIFKEMGISLFVPDLEEGDFTHLTVTRQMALVEKEIDKGEFERFAIIGSSMGGYLASLAANLREEVKGLYLMAPGFNFLSRWQKKLCEQFGSNIPRLIPIFHYRYNAIKDLDTFLFRDAEHWDKFSFNRSLPVRIVHGINDDTVNISGSREFASKRPWCDLKELDSDHALTSHIAWITRDCIEFFQAKGLM